MNKTAILFLFAIGILFSCSKKKENSSRHSTGKINAISIVIDNQLWNGVVGDTIRNKFASPVEGLPKEEPIFDINQYPANVMEGFVTKSRTIIVIKMGSENHFEVLKNQYATPQSVFHITGKSVAELLELIERNTPDIIQSIKKGEIAAHWELLKDSVVIPKTLQNQFQLDLKVPKSYSFSIKNKNFVWLKREFSSGCSSILVTQFPSGNFNLEGNILNQIVKIHDSIGAAYIKGEEPSSNMYIDTSYPLYLLEIALDGKMAYETRGTWRLKDSFMFGPFVSYLIVDPKKNRITYLVGFCYVPSKDRRDFMHELETILKEVRIN
ncbi:uncharacterized protein DUF4837 [Flavobacterium sp. 103]|uniref:DUF4837 family protein n=1 Tax=Flavobacterium sp. 103 TaxID=2135624 RepID=UPI000D5D7F40|nr:DUF4837 family protein [Flavobacterium sp. 103]PVX45752.1 uncharacterized protein DUF4837 [Flavobacterium sp. 103]